MLFNSVEFAIFLPLVFFIYWFIVGKNLRIQNLFLLIASYVFYGWWDWRFLSLIAFSSLVDYLVGIGLGKTDDRFWRKIFLLTSIFVNLGLLGFFKYFNFFADNFAKAFTFMGHPISSSFHLNVVLPVGISFYTFQTMSYSIDLYRRKFKPTKDIIAFFAFVSFFPQLVAGPIERAQNLLPQFYRKRVFDYDKAVDGMRQILWGLFKKIAVADNCATFVNSTFANYTNCSGSTLLLSAVFFSIQIYGDFSGYSDIAIGTARLFGFSLMRNFAFPYFSRDIAEFWRRWHISLSTWFRDYVYIPLGGSRGGTWMKIRNTFIIFVVSGFWHGANWTFVTWGFIHACYFLPIMLMKKNRTNLDVVASGRLLPDFKDLLRILYTFLLVTLALVVFRSQSVPQAMDYIIRIFSLSLFSLPVISSRATVVILILFVISEWLQRDKEHALQLQNVRIPRTGRWIIYYAIISLILLYGGNQQEFIYFQF